MSRSKKVLNFAYIEEKYLTTDEEPERQSTRKKLIITKLCLASTRSYANKPKLKFRHFGNYTKKAARLSREQNTRRRVKRRAEVTQEERIQDREINAGHQRVSRKRLELRFVVTAIGELEVFQEEAQLHQAPPVEEICQFFQAVKWKVETLNSCSRGGEVFAPLQLLLKISKSCLKTHYF
jgi:hypothetical protein